MAVDTLILLDSKCCVTVSTCIAADGYTVARKIVEGEGTSKETSNKHFKVFAHLRVAVATVAKCSEAAV